MHAARHGPYCFLLPSYLVVVGGYFFDKLIVKVSSLLGCSAEVIEFYTRKSTMYMYYVVGI